jgi:hypothetical protein
VSEHEDETPIEPGENDEPIEDEDDEELEAEDDEDAEAEPEPEPEPEQNVDEERVEAFKKIDRSFSTYRAAVERNLGDEVVDWLFCPLCSAGAVPGYFNKHDLGRIPEEVAANVKMVLGIAREQEYEPDSQVGTCTNCGGRGKTKTGSLVAEHATRTCQSCRGYGYVPPPGQTAGAPPINGVQPEASEITNDDLEQPDRDNWGEPKILPDGTLNDNYGKQPQFKTRHPVYGITAQLTGAELAGVAEAGGVL